VTLSRSQVVSLLEAHGLRPRRALGQNFVVDPNTVRRIARLARVEPGSAVVEIGPGLGALTAELAASGAHVLAVEVDGSLVPLLEEQVRELDVTILQTDALSMTWVAHLERERPGASWVLVGNLPYNIATPLIVEVLEQVPAVRRLVVMVQREVGERLAAHAGDPAYGAVSVKLAYWGTTAVLGRVPSTVFVPRPRVESVVVGIERHERPGEDLGVPYERLFSVVGAGFAHRRKMLRRSLAGVVTPAAFTAADVAPEARAEELCLEQWARLAAPDA
jgi:16S rRNA (adenine1518-N6/adenine1519-N6)-dimethyltransferase